MPFSAKNFLLYAGWLIIHTQASFAGDPLQAKYNATNMECNNAEMGKRIARRRKQLKIRQNNFAEAIGISNNHLSSIECGKSMPSLDIFVKICSQLGVTPDYLLLGSGRSNNIPKEITDSLNMCATEDLEVIYQIVQIYVRKNNENTIYDKTCL